MVDIVNRADAVLKVDVRGNSRDDIVDRNVLVVELFDDGFDFFLLDRKSVV